MNIDNSSQQATKNFNEILEYYGVQEDFNPFDEFDEEEQDEEEYDEGVDRNKLIKVISSDTVINVDGV